MRRGSKSISLFVRALVAATIGLAAMLPMTMSAQAANERELYLYYTHTKETVRIVYKRNGKFIQSALNELNVFLRDWRRNEPAKMDPALFDLLWEVYQEAGSSQPVHIVSAYRAPQTNAMLSTTTSGVAENSLHMQGKALDFFIPGVPVAKLREIGFRKQIGGVGYYPTSGSPFVHLDTGSVRAWPRMTEAQLRNVFPDGRTLHVPSNGRVLSQQGYQYAQAEWQRCHRVPCNAGAAMTGGAVQVADGERPRTLWDMITGGNNAQQAAPAPQQIAAAPAPAATPAATPAPVAVAAAPAQQALVEPPAPPGRPSALVGAPAVPENMPFQIIDAAEMTRQVAMADPGIAPDAPLPPAMSRTLAELRAATPSAYAPSGGATLDVTSVAEAPVPQPRPQFSTAPAPAAAAVSTPADLPLRPALDGAIQTAALDTASDLDAFAALFESPALSAEPDQETANAMASLTVAPGTLYAPDLDSVAESLLASAALSSDHFAFDGGSGTAGDGEDSTLTASRFTRTASVGPSPTSFGPAQTIWVHYDGRAN
ncbi:MAG TPA: DUF882 domain-containing protein [Pelagibacterium sp.]|uniref:DUF882 domain-containing protein n=1 Tax=Pelagibacterium sp. TaxID=1967288 RepID=UPI002C77BFBE|nr:DUF882 domain-containing protein [Pelagibacterium sp.]HWJ87042.1 DUF882 domain-containing protein [Pelagibacterium sp.]